MRSRSVELRDPGVQSMLSRSDSSSSDDETGDEALPQPAITTSNDTQDEDDPYKWRRRFVRGLALICAMSLSIGSHFGSYFLGPLKSRLSREIGTSNAEFSLMIAAFDLNSTWTPLVGGLLVSRLGTARSSIIATSAILLGQVILLIGDLFENVICMSIGLFIFGLGISPLAVAQETIVVRFFASHGLGISLAIGLIAGKGSSYVSARISYPLSQHFGPHSPFVVSTLLCLFSFGANLLYLFGSSQLAHGAGIEFEPGEGMQREIGAFMSENEAALRVGEKRKVKLKDLQRFGDVFWLYLGLNILCGAIWSPFIHLAANIIEIRYSLTEGEAGELASLLLAGALILYPICGLLTDRLKHGSVVFALFTVSSFLTLLCYAWLALPPSWTKSPLLAMLSFGCGHGFSTLLLVILVPHLIPLSHVSTGLGAHKSIEKVGSTISQTLAGLVLDIKKKKHTVGTTESQGTGANDSGHSIEKLLIIFLIVNVIQLLGTLVLWRDGLHLQSHPKHTSSTTASTNYQAVPAEDEPNEGTSHHESHHRVASDNNGSAVMNSEEEEEAEDLIEPSIRSSRKSDGGRLAGHLRNDGSWVQRTKPLLLNPNETRPNYQSSSLAPPVRYRSHPALARSSAQRKRGKVFMLMFIGAIVVTWALFLGTALAKFNNSTKDT